MKKFAIALLIASVLFSLVGCNRISISIHDSSSATLKFVGVWKGDNTNLTQALTAEEAGRIRIILSNAKHLGDGAGCPFDENISITYGDQVFAISYDDCNTVWDIKNNTYFEISAADKDYIDSVFEKYVGYFPFP